MQFIFLLHEHEADWRTMLLFAVGVLIFVALINAIAGGVLKRLDSAGRTQVAKKRKHKRGK
jgi:hypothetical protein